jgi:oxygen-independent coproporphyrinogen-3 oxidase
VPDAPLGVYVHFPWCRRLCSYCDFAVTIVRDGREPPHEAYRDAVLRELDERADTVAGRRLVSIYLGGGTPSLWRPDCLGDVIDAVGRRFGGAGPLEVTLETNPVDCTPGRMASWRAAGITRLSIGVQSLRSDELVTLGRDHVVGDGGAAVTAALAAGFASVSADVIVGTPVAGRGDPAATATALAAAGTPHLSVYELTLEPRTALGRARDRGTLVPLDDDELAGAYTAVHDALCARGFDHYEVSSYGRPGHRAIHNGLYWSGGEYLGLGVGAASFRVADDGRGLRETNVRQAPRYLAAVGAARVAETVVSTPAELAVDRLWLAMRTLDGVRAADAEATPGAAGALARLIDEGLCERAGARVRPTLRGLLCNDRIARTLVHACGVLESRRPA